MIVFYVILTLVCSLRACHMYLTRNYMFIREIWEKFTSFIVWNFEISLISLGRFQNFKKVISANLSQISLLNMWLLVLIKTCLHGAFEFSNFIYKEKCRMKIKAWNEKHSSKQVISMINTLEKYFFAAATFKGLWDASFETE